MSENSNFAENSSQGRIAIVGGGPSGLVLAIGLARRGLRSTIFERDQHPLEAPRFNPERSYTIDITGHGLKALRHIDVCSYFDEGLNSFNGIKVFDSSSEDWNEPGWTGSRGDILRALTAPIDKNYRDLIEIEYETKVDAADINTGNLTVTDKDGKTSTHIFDLIVGADGAGSTVRKAMEAQGEGFTTTSKSFPFYCTMLELDNVPAEMDRFYLHAFSARPFVVAGAIRGDTGPESSRWFCAVCTNEATNFASTDEAVDFFRNSAPKILDLTSRECIETFACRESRHIGQKLDCSSLNAGKGVLLGDAAAPFPPIGQGVNAAMESSMFLDVCIGETNATAEQLLAAADHYNRRWKPEADAISWISERSIFENSLHIMRAFVASKLGWNMFSQAKSSTVPYSEVRRVAEKRWPFWA